MTAPVPSPSGQLAPGPVASPVPSKRRSRVVTALVVILALICVVIGGVVWLVSTHKGARASLALAQHFSKGTLQLSGVSGSLNDDVTIAHLSYRTDALHITADDLHLRWQGTQLAYGKLVIDRAEVRNLQIATVLSQQPTPIPVSLQLPVAVSIKQAAIDHLILAHIEGGKETPNLELNTVAASLNSTRTAHALKISLNSMWGHLNGDINIAAVTPFALQGKVHYSGQPEKMLPQLGFDAKLHGDLKQFVVDGKAVADQEQHQLNGDLHAIVTPFSLQPVQTLRAHFAQFNPADFIAHAPQASLSLDADITPQKDQSVVGQILINNAAPGPINLGRLPLQQLQTQLHWLGQILDLKAIQIELVGQAKLTGEARIELPATEPMAKKSHDNFPLVDARLSVHGLDLAKLDQRAQSTNIKGTINVQTAPDHAMSLQARLTDPRAQLNADARYQLAATLATTGAKQSEREGDLTVSKLELIADDSRVLGHGSLSLRGTRAFAFNATLQNFDPARWITVAHGSINAEFKGDGQLAPHRQINLQVPQLQGQYAGQNVRGVIDLSAADEPSGLRAQIKKFDMALGKNTVTAMGFINTGSNTGLAGERTPQELIVNVDALDLNAFSSMFNQALAGSLTANARLHGRANALAGHVEMQGKNIQVARQFSVGVLSGKFDLDGGLNGNIDGLLTVQDVRTSVASVPASETAAPAVKTTIVKTSPPAPAPISKPPNNVSDAAAAVIANGAATIANSLTRNKSTTVNTPPAPVAPVSNSSAPVWQRVADKVSLTVKGKRAAHQITLTSTFNQQRGMDVLAQGGFAGDGYQHWIGRLERFAATGLNPLQLTAPMSVDASSQLVRLGPALFKGDLGQLSLEQFEWTPTSIKTRGAGIDLKAVDILNAIKPQRAAEGDLRLNAAWNIAAERSLKADITLQRQSGDLFVTDQEGANPPLALGLRTLQLHVIAEGDRVNVVGSAEGARLGKWSLNLNSQVRKNEGQWSMARDAPLGGLVKVSVPDIQWLGSWLSPGLALKGKLYLDAKFAGNLSAPHYQAKLSGRDLELGLLAEGVLLPNGILDARVDGKHITLERLQFSNTITMMPRHAEFREINWLGHRGEFNASGELDIGSNNGKVEAQWQHFPFLQRSDRWLVASGQATITETNQVWSLLGKTNADAAFFKLPKLPPPSLSSDVTVINRKTKNGQIKANVASDMAGEETKKPLKTRLDVILDMGPHFVFQGRGLDTVLAGNVRLRATDSSALQAYGTIRADRGTYEGYGQQLEIERGILNFQGAPNNPGLNVRALRRGLAVEAGVEVTGTVAGPQVRLVSEPSVPDAEKLSWLVLGRGSDQLAGGDASLLLTAAGAIFGGDGSSNVPRDLVQRLGFDEFSIGNADLTAGSKIPSRTVAGTTTQISGTGSATADQVVTVGKRLAPGLVLSIERGLSDANGALKLSWHLSRRVSIIARTGTDASVDAYYTFSFK